MICLLYSSFLSSLGIIFILQLISASAIVVNMALSWRQPLTMVGPLAKSAWLEKIRTMNVLRVVLSWWYFGIGNINNQHWKALWGIIGISKHLLQSELRRYQVFHVSRGPIIMHCVYHQFILLRGGQWAITE